MELYGAVVYNMACFPPPGRALVVCLPQRLRIIVRTQPLTEAEGLSHFG